MEALTVNGILPLWKPKGLTSHDCVVKIRRKLNIKKVGHTGTLDPDVAGVLPICIGEATKVIPFLEGKKKYIAHASIGKATETEDQSGKVIAEEKIKKRLTNEKIDTVLNEFIGNIVQIPPIYSAVKVKGKRLYEYARENIEVERPKRNVTIYHISRLHDRSLPHHEIRFKVVCSKGTYIRTLCVDIGKKLGYPAHMSFLERIESDFIQKDETVTFNEIDQAVKNNHIQNLLLPMERTLSHLETIQVTAQNKRRILHGQKLKKSNFSIDQEPFIMKFNDAVLAIYKTDKEEPTLIRPIRVFNVLKNEGDQ